MGSGQFDSRIDEIQASRDATSQLLEEVEEAKRDLEMEILRRKKIEKVLKKSYLRLKGSPGSETVQTRVNRGFLATMNHEIRTPLNSITGFLALLKQTKLTPEQQEYANAVLSASKSLLLLISDILDTSTIEAGQLELGRVPFLLDEVVKDICSTMAIQAHVKGLELNWQIEPGTPLYLVGDASRLRQVLANLVENAVKFTKKGEVFLRVQKKGFDGHRTTLSFSVIDTGKGVSPGEKEKLFCSFFKDDRSGTKEIFGTGLGLHISKKIVEMMDGEID
ncbi:MAG: sensor histidine kinase, partial [Nitrospinota bacterium]